jgi:hypothetical protein
MELHTDYRDVHQQQVLGVHDLHLADEARSFQRPERPGEFKIVEGILPLQTGNFSSTITPAGTKNQYSEIFGILEANKREIQRLRSEQDRGIAPPKADERIGDLELHNAELLGRPRSA